MKNYKFIFFDLDGTLTDSEPGILNSFKYACDELGIDYSKANLKTILGPPLLDSFMELSGGNKALSEKAVECYRGHFPLHGMLYENKLYDGVTEMLENLHKMGYKLLIATSKPEEYALKIAQHFGLTKFFAGIYGGTFDGARTSKDDVLSFALKQSGGELDSSIMIGDRKHDLSAANSLGIDVIGVLYGYGDREELEQYKYVMLAENTLDIIRFFCK